MGPPIMESLYFLALILCPYYSVPKCTLFSTTTLKRGIKKKVYFNLLLNIKPNLIFGAGYVILYTMLPLHHISAAA
jgi:hypothetical protein